MNFEIAPKETMIRANWNDAKLYCFALNIDGKTGWRLPTKDELNQIYKSKNDLDGRNTYWTSTEVDGEVVYVQFFYDGQQYSAYKDSINGCARAVRTI